MGLWGLNPSDSPGRRFIMDPHREEAQKALPPGAEPKPKRFRIVKLEERIAPKGGDSTAQCAPMRTNRNCIFSGSLCICW
jgi:hypothetical protein